jgi:hypothetical protein
LTADTHIDEELYPELESEAEQPPVEEDTRPVFSQPHDWTISSLREKYEKGLIDLTPEYQRGYVWALKDELPPRLIESILLEIPIPPIYLGKLQGGKMDVIDGQQRLTTLFRFVGNQLMLKKLQRLSGLNGKRFRELHEELQNKILDAPIRSIVIDTGSNDTLRYEVFERLNRGAMALTEQEIRNAVYRGPFNALLARLEKDPVWRKIRGTPEPDPRFIEREMILRFFAFSQRIDSYSGNLKRFLNDYMGTYAPRDPQQIDEMEAMFTQTMKNVYTVFGEHSARLYSTGTEDHPTADGRWESKFSVAALDIQASALNGQNPARVQAAAEQIREAYIFYLLTNAQVRLAISRQPAGTTATKTRWYGFKSEVQRLLSGVHIEPRFFSYEFRKQLYDRSPVCQLCHNQIHSLEDATVDHIHPYSKGGKTVPDNAQLAHRSCNAKKCANVEAGLPASSGLPTTTPSHAQPPIPDRTSATQHVTANTHRQKPTSGTVSGAPHSLNEDFTYTRPSGLIFEDQTYQNVGTWHRLYELVCSQLAARDPARFAKLPSNPAFTSSRGRRHFSTDPSVLRTSSEITNGIYAEVNHSANTLAELIKNLLKEFGIPLSRVTIYLHEEKGAGNKSR